jgi:O-antigen/teichoic acid export membrane protein
VRKLSQIIGLKIKNGYFLSRGLSSLLAFIFSLYYSKELGIEKRSLVTFILVVVVLVIIAFTSGIGLAFRKYTSSSPGLISLPAYLYANIILAFFVSLCTSAILLLYSSQYNSIPPTLFFLTLIYSFLGSLDFNYHQGLIAFGMFKIASILDTLTITIQIFVFFLLTISNQVSIAASLFTALIISFVTSVVSAGLILLVHTNASIKTSWSEIDLLIRKSLPLYLIGIANGFADRVDRIAIALFLPLGFLGKYAVGTSILSYLRFIPEAFSRLIVGGHSDLQVIASRLISKSLPLRISIGVLVCFSFASFSQGLIWLILGKEWLIPFIVVFIFSVQEFIRGYFQIRISSLVVAGKESLVSQISVLLIILSTVLSFIGVNFVGLVGVPIGIALTYLILIFYSNKNLKAVTK